MPVTRPAARRPIPWLVLLLVAGLSLAAPAAADDEAEDQADTGDELVTVELSTIGLDAAAGAPVVLLRDVESNQVVPIWVGVAEAQAIYIALRGLAMPRPMTHDLLADVIRQLDAKVEQVVVHDLRAGTYIGRVQLTLNDADEARHIDARPSDAMALALRVDAPIRVARKILDDAPPIDFVIPDELDPVVRTLGITVIELTDPRRRAQGVPDGQAGVFVSNVVGDAREQGLRPDDVILAANDQPTPDPMAFFRAVREAMQTGSVQLTAWRDGETFQIELDIAIPVPPRPERREPRMEI